MMTRTGACAVTLLLISCTAPRTLPLRPTPSVSVSDPHLLHVFTSVEEAADPLPLHGENVLFTDVAASLGEVIAQAASDWARRHASHRVGGWDLKVQLLQSRAEVSHGRMTVELAARLTVTGTLGQVYLAQTHGYCRQNAVADESIPAQPVYACMNEMAHDLAGWLEGIQP